MRNHEMPSSLIRLTRLMLASAAVAALTGAGTARAQDLPDVFNEWDVPSLDPLTNSFGPTGIQMIFSGNAIADGCLQAQVTADATINPFYAEQIWMNPNGGGQAHHTSIVYDVNTNQTVVTLSGTKALLVPPPPSGTFPGPTDGNNIQGYPLSYHSGLTSGFPSSCVNNPFVTKQWVWKRGRTVQYGPIPVYEPSFGGVINGGNIKYAKGAVIYAETTSPAVTGTWTFVPYAVQEGTEATFQLQNNGPTPLTLGNVGFLGNQPVPTDKTCWKKPNCKEMQVILDHLNSAGYPVSGANSPFTPLEQLDGVVLQPGQIVKFNYTQP